MEQIGAGPFVAFDGLARLAAGSLAEAAVAAKRALERGGQGAVLVFDQATGAVRDLDLRGSEAEIAARYAPAEAPASRRGRPRLGVVAREVTLLPRHWEWLASQPGGASVALRKLVEAARKRDDEVGGARRRVEAAYRFISAIAGDLPGFEDAARALFARDKDRLRDCVRAWPPDVRDELFRFLRAGEEAVPG
ncbi:DUF2239 family protein [Muricoccus roseus]|nr:DUF2239 family protein [Roseomonas rosea]